MEKVAIVWFRDDLRVRDHPALATAATRADVVIPVYIFEKRGNSATRLCANHDRFLTESLIELRASLQALGSDLLIRSGDPSEELAMIARETGASKVFCTRSYSAQTMRLDTATALRLADDGIDMIPFSGTYVIENLPDLRTKTGHIYKMFTPFWRNWQTQPRRSVLAAPTLTALPQHIPLGEIPNVTSDNTAGLSPHAARGGEVAARDRLQSYLEHDIKHYVSAQNNLGADRTSRLSPYLRFGCISAREIETMLDNDASSAAFHRQLAWRDFYAYVLLHFPNTTDEAFQGRYRSLKWGYDMSALHAWQNGQTGYPIVDAAMRQLKAEGWMHNRARLIVGSFLTKDLGLDWRLGEQHFMCWLTDGDIAQNVGNWQWIASIGVDPAPLFRRLYNPISQQTNYDPGGSYVRKYVPELANVPFEYLATPWTMSLTQQQAFGCVIGKDYPYPIVDHTVARAATIERYNEARRHHA